MIQGRLLMRLSPRFPESPSPLARGCRIPRRQHSAGPVPPPHRPALLFPLRGELSLRRERAARVLVQTSPWRPRLQS